MQKAASTNWARLFGITRRAVLFLFVFLRRVALFANLAGFDSVLTTLVRAFLSFRLGLVATSRGSLGSEKRKRKSGRGEELGDVHKVPEIALWRFLRQEFFLVFELARRASVNATVFGQLLVKSFTKSLHPFRNFFSLANLLPKTSISRPT